MSSSLTVRVGFVVSWQYGGGQPSGEVAEKKTEGEVAITSKRGNTIKRNADPDNPALHVSRSGNDVVKRMSEVEVADKADDEPDEQETTANGDEKMNTGDKRPAEDEPADEEPPKKAKVGRGRPKKVAGAPPAKKAAATKKKSASNEKKAAPSEAAEPSKAEAAKSEATKSEATKSEAAKPEAAKPEAAKPEATNSAKPEDGSPAKGETTNPAKSEATNSAKGEADSTKKGRGRPRKEEGTTATPKTKATNKEKKPSALANGTGVGSRTRSAKK